MLYVQSSAIPISLQAELNTAQRELASAEEQLQAAQQHLQEGAADLEADNRDLVVLRRQLYATRTSLLEARQRLEEQQARLAEPGAGRVCPACPPADGGDAGAGGCAAALLDLQECRDEVGRLQQCSSTGASSANGGRDSDSAAACSSEQEMLAETRLRIAELAEERSDLAARWAVDGSWVGPGGRRRVQRLREHGSAALGWAAHSRPCGDASVGSHALPLSLLRACSRLAGWRRPWPSRAHAAPPQQAPLPCLPGRRAPTWRPCPTPRRGTRAAPRSCRTRRGAGLVAGLGGLGSGWVGG